tara:strand:+ start:5236 stop:5472 length:237 start_codon:yes stop_codon:yes gene_type:complete
MSHQANDELKENKSEEDWEEYGAWTDTRLCQHCKWLIQNKWEQQEQQREFMPEWWYRPLQKLQKFKQSLPRYISSLFD